MDPAAHPRERILFVDDEAAILGALQNLLRRQRGRWDMVFVESGAAALAALEAGPFDVIVSDMRMPQMDGATLLGHVKTRHPSVIRVILSGHAEREALTRALPVMHQYLSKPCDVSLLLSVIERACALRALLVDQRLRELIGGVVALPSPPRCYLELQQMLLRSDTSLERVAAVIEQDPALTAKLLQLVNSAYFGLPVQVTSVVRATHYLGIDLLKGLLLTAQVFDPRLRVEGLSLEALQAHSLMTARVAHRLAGRRAVADDLFTVALLHDIGRLLVASADPAGAARTVREAALSRRPLWEVEKEIFGVTHEQVGGYLLGMWGLPLRLVEAVAFHHHPAGLANDARELVAWLHLADAVCEGADDECAPDADARLDRELLAHCHLEVDVAGARALAEAMTERAS